MSALLKKLFTSYEWILLLYTARVWFPARKRDSNRALVPSDAEALTSWVSGRAYSYVCNHTQN